MRMASITLPLFDNHGMGIPEVHEALQDKLLDKFGGYSERKIVGAWRDPNSGRTYRDHNAVYDVAMEDTLSARGDLRRIAREAGRAAEQLAVMVTQPSGEVEFLTIDHVEVGVAA